MVPDFLNGAIELLMKTLIKIYLLIFIKQCNTFQFYNHLF
jgi:hypothetical protein